MSQTARHRTGRGLIPRCSRAAALLCLALGLHVGALQAQQQDTAPKQCLHNGQMWDHGTRVGHLVCNDGRWVPG